MNDNERNEMDEDKNLTPIELEIDGVTLLHQLWPTFHADTLAALSAIPKTRVKRLRRRLARWIAP